LKGNRNAIENSSVARRRQEAAVLSGRGRRRFIERLGIFDPLKAKDAEGRIVLDLEKAKAWVAKGAQPTDRVARLLDSLGVLPRVPRNNPKQALPRKKARERAAAAAAKPAATPAT
jgi:small subunit ribosomal protein S16